MKKTPGNIRIIGGFHRSRKLEVIDAPGLRPTTDRIRETLFNWLYDYISNADVLDLYAGTGVLGIEAISRGAQSVTFIENNRKTLDQLKNNIETLKIDTACCLLDSAQNHIKTTKKKFDIIFLDPPFNSPEMEQISGIIQHVMKPHGLLYREYALDREIQPLPETEWQLLKSKKAGHVFFELWKLND